MHRGELVEDLRLNELQTGLEEFSSNTKGEHAANHQHRETKPEIERPDVLVVGGKQPAL